MAKRRSAFDNSFSIKVKKWTRKVGDNADVFSKKLVLDLDERISKRSPVDTGRFKGNWMLGVDSPPTTYDYKKFDKAGRGRSGNTVLEHLGKIPKKAAGHVYYLVNNLPYAIALEQGRSKQAPGPGGVVYITVLEYEQAVAKALAGLKK